VCELWIVVRNKKRRAEAEYICGFAEEDTIH
jgi:hypothetical protein